MKSNRWPIRGHTILLLIYLILFPQFIIPPHPTPPHPIVWLVIDDWMLCLPTISDLAPTSPTGGTWGTDIIKRSIFLFSPIWETKEAPIVAQCQKWRRAIDGDGRGQRPPFTWDCNSIKLNQVPPGGLYSNERLPLRISKKSNIWNVGLIHSDVGESAASRRSSGAGAPPTQLATRRGGSTPRQMSLPMVIALIALNGQRKFDNFPKLAADSLDCVTLLNISSGINRLKLIQLNFTTFAHR